MIAETQHEAVERQGKAYLEAGLCLVPIHAGQKRPTGAAWNSPDNIITSPADWYVDAAGCGLAHVQSRTCTLDVDDYHTAVDWLFEHSIDLVNLQMRDDAVQIVSGRQNRAKLLYKLPDGIEPLETRQPEGSGLELRCAARTGATLQDLLPPSIHPDTNLPYQWVGNWKNLPTLPHKLLELWQSLPSRATTAPALGDNDYLEALAGNGVLIGTVNGKPGAHEIECPWSAAHTNGDKAAMYFEPHTNGFAGHGFRCLHAHCADRGIDELSKFLGVSSLGTLTLGGKPVDEVKSSRNSRVAGPAPSAAAPKKVADDEALPLFRSLDEGAPYPTRALGEVLGPMAEHLADTTHVAPGLAAQAVLGAASLVAQTHYNVALGNGCPRPLSLFLLTVQASGDRKTTIDAQALRPIKAHERTLHEGYEKQCQQYKMDLIYWQQQEKGAEKLAQDGKTLQAQVMLENAGRKPVPPPVPELTLQDPTIPGLVKHLAHGWPSCGLFSDEGGTFLGGWSLQDENRIASAASLSGMWDGSPISRTRAGEDPLPKLFGRRLSIHLMAQPGVAPMLLGDERMRDQGLLSRFLVSYPASKMGNRPFSDEDIYAAPCAQKYEKALTALLQREPNWSATLPNTLEPTALKIEGAARTALIGLYNETETQLKPDGALRPIQGLASKALEHACRIAGVLTAVNDPQLRELRVTDTAAECAVELVRHYVGEAVRLRHLADQNPQLAVAQRLLEWAQTRPTDNDGVIRIHARQIYQYGPYGIRDRETALQVAETLETHGWFIRSPAGAKVEGRVRSAAWEVRI